MTKPTRRGVWAGAASFACAFGLLPGLPASAQQENAATELEEVVVTGSYIKRDSFDSASPITIVDQEAISNNATPNLGEVLVNQTFNYGSDFQTNTYGARPQIGSTTNANLRGLGTRATLDLIDGKRTASGNLTSALPQIAIDRIDILKDGASAIYGTDAVAGVVNIITRKNFSGTKFSAFYQRDKDDTLDEQQYEFIAGSDTDDGHITMAFGYKSRGALEQTERPEFLRGGFERSGTGNPGRWSVPVRDATGAITSSRTLRDPGCGVGADQWPGGTDVGSKGNHLTGNTQDVVEWTLGLPGGVRGTQECGFHFGETWNFINPIDQYSAWTNYQFEFADGVYNEIDIQATRLITDSRGSPQNPGGRTEEFPIVRGEHPGNPFRAFSDLNGNGAIDDGERLYAQDADGDGLPDRGTVDANGDGVADVILAANPFDPAAGVPFNEDVDVVALRIFSKIGLMPSANQPTSLNADGSNTGNASFDSINYRVMDTLTWELDNGWTVAASGTFERIHTVLENKNTSQSALEQGLLGMLQADPTDDSDSYWNPFATQALSCVDRVCQYTGTADFQNSVSVLDAVNIQSHNITDTEFWVADVIASGELFEVSGGTVGMAIGAEYRKTKVEADIDSARNQCDWHEGGCQFDYSAQQDVYSLFGEVVAPLIPDFELQLAGRFTDYGGGIGDSFDPKVAVLWQPLDILSLRGSYSTAFIAPTIEEQFEPEDCGLQTFSDPLTNDNSGTFRVACVSGNPTLTPESADVFNIGFSLSLLDGDLNLGLDYAEYDFQDRIAQTTGNQVVRADYNNFLASGGNPDPASGDADGDGVSDSAEAWIASSNSDPAIQRDFTGIITRVATSRINAQEMLHRAMDLYARYNLSVGSFGDFVFNIQATQALEYSYNLGTGDPLDNGDGIGLQNEQVAEIPPMPEWRINGTVNWFMGNHSAFLRARYIDGFDLVFNSGGVPSTATGGLALLHRLRGGGDSVDDITYVDVNYKYTFPSLLGARETTVEIGANNVTDEFPEPFFNLGGLETFVHDVRGRMWYVRVNQDI